MYNKDVTKAGKIGRPHKMSRSKDRRAFSHHADKTHRINSMQGLSARPMRGGIRL